MAYNPLDEHFVNQELKHFFSATRDKFRYNNRVHKWRERFAKNKLSLTKKVEILLTYADFELTKKK